MSRLHRVPGEDFGLPVAGAFVAVGVLLAVGFVGEASSAKAATKLEANARTRSESSAPTGAVGSVDRSQAGAASGLAGASSSLPVVAAAPSSSSASASTSASATAPSSAPSAPKLCQLIVGFESAYEDPPKSADAALSAWASWLVAHPDVGVRIEGHADAHGDETTNLILSRKRAAAVAAMFATAGVARARVTVRAFGAYQPIDGEDEGAAIQRRVVVSAKPDGGCPANVPEVVTP